MFQLNHSYIYSTRYWKVRHISNLYQKITGLSYQVFSWVYPDPFGTVVKIKLRMYLKDYINLYADTKLVVEKHVCKAEEICDHQASSNSLLIIYLK